MALQELTQETLLKFVYGHLEQLIMISIFFI